MLKQFTPLFVLLLLFASCSKQSNPLSEKPSILVSIAPYAYFAQQIAGNTIEIQTLIPPGTNLHIYEPSPKSVEENTTAQIWFRIDEPIEKPIAAALTERNPNMRLINLQEGLDLLIGNDAIELGSCTNHNQSRDLHTWLSPKLALKQAEMMATALIALLPENKDLYQKNFTKFKDKMVQLERDLQMQLNPFHNSALLVSHPAFGYFCRDFGLLQLSIECEGKEPRPRDIEKILKHAKKYKTRCVFLQKGFDNRGAQLLSKKLQLQSYQVDPYAWDYLTNMRKISGYIAK